MIKKSSIYDAVEYNIVPELTRLTPAITLDDVEAPLLASVAISDNIESVSDNIIMDASKIDSELLTNLSLPTTFNSAKTP